MMPHTPLSLLWVADATSPALSSLAAYLESIPHVPLTRVTQWPADLGNHDVVISRGAGGGPDVEGFVRITPAMAEREAYAYHRNLADHLLLGEPIGAPLADSVKVVAILEATARSMSRGGTREVIDGD